MKNKLIIEGQEFELPQSLVDEIKERLTPKVKKLTYEDVAKRLFKDKKLYYNNFDGRISSVDNFEGEVDGPNNATSKKQIEKLLAINKMMNVGKYLNGDWKIDWIGTSQLKYYLYLSIFHSNISIAGICNMNDALVYFRSRELAQQAIDILGEDVIKLALSTDY
jgi:hypothetical protein